MSLQKPSDNIELISRVGYQEQARPKIVINSVIGCCLLLALFVASRHNYLLFHTLVEFFSVAIAFAVFIVVWNVRQYIGNTALVYIGIAYLFTGGLDLIHTIVYSGMGLLADSWGANSATQLWIASRYMESISLFVFVAFFKKRFHIFKSLIVYSVITIILLLSIFYWRNFPDCLIEGVGLTNFKKISEYFICGILVATLALILRSRDDFDQKILKLFIASIALTIFSELAFTFYDSVYGVSNLIGHFLKLLSFFLIYVALVHYSLKEPYRILFRDLNIERQRLKRSMAQHLEVQKVAKIGHWEFDFSSGTSIWSDELLYIFGLDLQNNEPDFADIKDIIYSEDLRPLINSIQVLSTKKIPFDMEFRIIRPQSQIGWVQAKGSAETGENGTVLRIFGTAQDVSERRRAYEKLREKDAMLANLASQVPGMLYQFKMAPDGTYSVPYSSQGVKGIFGCSPEDVRDNFSPIFKAIHPGDRNKILQTIDESVKNMSQWICEYRVQLSGKPIKWIFGNSIPEKRADGSIVWSGYNVDITERKEAEDALQHLNRVLEQKVAEGTKEAVTRSRQLKSLALQLIKAEIMERDRIARLLHDDLQQDLASVKMRLDMISTEDGEPNEPVAHCSNLLSKAIQKTRKLSHDLSPPGLRFSGLMGSMDWLVEEFRKNHGLKLELTRSDDAELESRSMTVFLYQALKELLFNVVKHSGEKTAHVDLQAEEGWVVLRVADSGKGAELEKVFARRGIEPGFGLFSIEERVQSLGGRMTIETAPGEGWTTTLTLPKARAVGETAPERKEAEEAAGKPQEEPAADPADSQADDQSAIRIVIADDHLVMREGLAGLLDGETGLQVVGQAGNGREAVALVLELRPDLVLMDVNMPDMDGIEATAIIRGTLPDIPILGLSMHDGPDVRQRMLDAGALGFLSKTDSPTSFIQAVHRCASAFLST